MANLLYRIGRACFRHYVVVGVVWLLALGALLGGVALAGKPTTASVSIPGTESQRALDALAKEFPEASGASGVIAVRAPKGQTLTEPANQKVVAALVAKANQLPGVTGAMDPYQTQAIGKDARYATITVQFEKVADLLTNEDREAFEKVGEGEPAGWTVASGGEALLTEPEVGSTEAIGVAVALIVLLITFGSLVAAGMTMLNALVGVGAGMAAITLVGHVVDLSSTTPILALMLGLAVGIDYSLFISARYRHNIAIGLEPQEAAGRAVGTAGSAVVFAGLTVVIALAGLSVVGIPFLTVMGLAAAGTVSIAVLVAITLLPALLSLGGTKVLSRRQRKALSAGTKAEDLDEAESNRGFAWGRFVVRRRLPVLIVGIAALGLLAIPVASLELALPDDGSSPTGTSKREAYDLVTEGFGEGANGRLVILVNADDPAQAQQAVKQATGIATTTDGVVAVTPPQPSADGKTLLSAVIPDSAPSDQSTVDLVRTLRSELAPVSRSTGADIALTGVTAVGIDVSTKLGDALPLYLAVVLGLSFALLMLVFRSILVPLKATLGFLLTLGATFGVTVAVFQWGWLSGLVGLDTSGPLVSFLPIILIGVLFGLAMDYEVFLVSRMREDFVHGTEAREAVVSGVGHGSRVVVAAALIMISVFAGFMLIEDPIIKSMGFALAFGVLIDAFVVRLTLVPAVMSFLGKHAWWLPRWMDKAMPSVDIEGEGLRGDPTPASDSPAPGKHAATV